MKSFSIKKVRDIGKGLYANKNFKKGELLFKIDLSKLKTYSSEETKNHPQNEHADYVGKGRYVITFHPYSYINHSCNPNVLIKHDTIKKSRFYAMRDIKVGEQLTYDYGVNALDQIDKELWKVKCKCGSKNCRKILSTCFFNQTPEIQKRYYKHLPSSIKRKYKDKIKF
ncbi:MAG: SET domain-containing protein-lysine N-methyltransferase [Candidatus Pacearchaeota archaeon]|jgi:hypothetical protein